MISIIIPVFNEELRLKENLEEIYSYLKSEKVDSEIVIVNDGSSDKTGEILKSLEQKFDLKIITHIQNMGKGAAIKSGVNNCKGDVVLFTDIDLSVPIEFTRIYLDNLSSDTDIIIGTRANINSKIEVKQFWLREMMGEFFTFLSNFILQVNVSDFTCGFKMFRKKAAVLIFNKQLVKRWAFDAESLYIARKNRFKIKEVPVVWRHRAGSKVRFPMDIIETFFSLIKIRINDLSGKYK